MAKKAIPLYLEDEDIKELGKIAKKYIRSRNSMIEYIIKQFLKDNK